MTNTPGPWRVGDAGHTVFGPKTDAISPETIATMGKNNFRENARLIAACPDMLEALKDAEYLLRKAGQGSGSIKKDFDKHLCLASASRIAEIIDKAEGRE